MLLPGNQSTPNHQTPITTSVPSIDKPSQYHVISVKFRTTRIHRVPVLTAEAAVLTNAFLTPSSLPFSTSGFDFIVRLVRLGSAAMALFRRIGIIDPGLVGVAGGSLLPPIGVLSRLEPVELGFL